MSVFVCKQDTCPNKDVVYDFGDDNPPVAECGGCKAKLTAQ